MKVYVVIGDSRDYDSGDVWPVKGFYTKEKADEYARFLEAENVKACRNYKKQHKKYYNAPWQKRINTEPPDRVDSAMFNVEEIELE